MEEGTLKTGKKKGLNENRLVTTKKNLTRNDQESKPGVQTENQDWQTWTDVSTAFLASISLEG